MLEKAKYIEDEILPQVSKIADDEDEIEILKGKKSILKEVKRAATDILNVDLEENVNQKLQRIILKREEPYDIIEKHKEIY